MPATTSALMALRLSGRLMVIQNACPRFSRITLLMSFIVPLACPLLLCNHLRQDGAALQAGIQGAAPTPAETSTENQRSSGPGRRSFGFRARKARAVAAMEGRTKPNTLKFSIRAGVM